MDRKEFEQLAAQLLNGNISADDEQRLSAYYDALQQETGGWDENAMGQKDQVKGALYARVLRELAAQREADRHSRGRHVLFSWKAAAVFTVMVSAAALYFYLKPEQGIPLKKEGGKQLVRDIGPGGNKAILTLANGTRIALDTAGKDAIYRMKAAAPLPAQEAPVYNTISTPLSGQYQLVLADGSRVWLNAGSSIRFPLAFSQTERSVTLKGEAYFEVAADKKRPFKVQSGRQQLEVLGTHFNVNAYEDEAEIRTTLLEGAVKIASGESRRILKPGQQAQLSGNTNEITVKQVDVEEAVSWKNGYFIFDNEDIHSVMRKISRWYGVEVIYADPQISENFGGTISKFENVSQVLKVLEATGTIHFKIEGRKIIVM